MAGGVRAHGAGVRAAAAHLRRARRADQPPGPPPPRRGHRRRGPRRALPAQRRRLRRGDAGGVHAPGRADQHQLPLRRRRAGPPGQRLGLGRAPVPPVAVGSGGRRPRPGAGRCGRCSSSTTSWTRAATGPPVPGEVALRRRARRGVARAARGRGSHRRRPLHHVHRRHDRPAEGRRVAPGGRVLQLHGRRRPVPPRRPDQHAGRDPRSGGARPRLPAGRADDARRRAVDDLLVPLRWRQGRPHARLASTPRRSGRRCRTSRRTRSRSSATPSAVP